MVPATARERPEYLPPYPGWRQAFGCRNEPAADRAQITLPKDLDTLVRAAASPAQTLAGALNDGLRALALVRDSFDVIVFYLPSQFAPCFSDGSFDLHDAVKAIGAELGLATALYAKAGWVPWKLQTRPGPLDPQAATSACPTRCDRWQAGRQPS